jgi:hypothetical protein
MDTAFFLSNGIKFNFGTASLGVVAQTREKQKIP